MPPACLAEYGLSLLARLCTLAFATFLTRLSEQLYPLEAVATAHVAPPHHDAMLLSCFSDFEWFNCFYACRRLVWVPDSSSAAGSTSVACSYKQISMHAVARDTEAFPKPCVYIQLDEGSVGMGAEAEDEGEEEEEDTAELRLVPAQDSEGKLRTKCVHKIASHGTGCAAQGAACCNCRSLCARHQQQLPAQSHVCRTVSCW